MRWTPSWRVAVLVLLLLLLDQGTQLAATCILTTRLDSASGNAARVARFYGPAEFIGADGAPWVRNYGPKRVLTMLGGRAALRYSENEDLLQDVFPPLEPRVRGFIEMGGFVLVAAGVFMGVRRRRDGRGLLGAQTAGALLCAGALAAALEAPRGFSVAWLELGVRAGVALRLNLLMIFAAVGLGLGLHALGQSVLENRRARVRPPP